MKQLFIATLVATLLVACGKPAPSIDIWTAISTGNLTALREHVAAGTDLNQKEPTGGGTPLMAAALHGQTEAAKLLLEQGAKIDTKNKEGSSALLVAAFFCQTETVELLLGKGADVNAKNNKGETPLSTVTGAWSPELEGAYVFLGNLLHAKVDLDRIKRVRPEMAELLRKHGAR